MLLGGKAFNALTDDELLSALREADRARNEARVQALQIELRELYRELKVSVQAP